MNNSITYNLGFKKDNKFLFTEKHSLANRQATVQKYSKENQIVVVCEPHKLFKSKYENINTVLPILILNKHDPVKSILKVIEMKIKLDKQEVFFLFCNNKILQTEEKLEEVYEKHKNSEDLILYVKFCNQEAFGHF